MRRVLGMVGMAAALWAGGATVATAQDINPDALRWEVVADPAVSPAGTTGVIRVRGELVEHHHIYAHDAEFVPTTVTVPPVAGVTFGTPVYPPAHVVDRWGEASREYEGQFEITVPYTVAADAAAGARTITVLVSYQICNEEVCLDPVKEAPHTATLTVQAGAAAPAPAPAPQPPIALPPLGGGAPDPSKAKADLVSAAADATGVALTLRIAEGWHIGPVTVPGDAIATATTFELQGATLNGPVVEPAPTLTNEAGFASAYHAGTVTLRLPLRYEPGATQVTGTVVFQICSSGEGGVCVDGRTPFAFAIPADVPAAVPGPAVPAVPPPASGDATLPPAPGAAATEQSDAEKLAALPFPAFLLLCMGFGAFSLVMPCVYPLIPITVTFFAKQAGESGQGKTMGLAVMYALGIISSFTALGAILTLALGETGATVFASNPWVNTIVAAVFLYFALAMFGLVPLDLPAGLKNRISGGAPRKGFIGAYVLGLIFTVVTFTCVVPFAGNLMAIAAKGGFVYGTFGMLVFSTTMAAPFLVLGLFPSFIRKMPMGGGWLHTVKMTGGFIELALVAYYWTKADQGFFGREVFVNHDLALAIYVGAFMLAGTYLLGLWRTPEDGDVKAIGAPRMLFAFVFVVLGLYLGTGLAGKDLGVLEAVLPLQEARAAGDPTTAVATATKPKVYEDFEQGMAQARATGKPAFVEFTGFT